MSIWDTFTNAIKSIPEAAVLREHVSLLRDQFTAVEQRATVAESRVHDLELENADLRDQIRNFQEQLSTGSGNRRKPIEERILSLLVSRPHLTAPLIAHELETNPETIKFHLEELKQAHMVNDQVAMGTASRWHLAQDGRGYLMEYGLLK
ncbi:MAG: hypothetical protein HYZ50_01325 [Deltaproteobacteria bacterium]|nr:hypothetical protein [Deltaproteobacteria bacterium]